MADTLIVAAGDCYDFDSVQQSPRLGAALQPNVSSALFLNLGAAHASTKDISKEDLTQISHCPHHSRCNGTAGGRHCQVRTQVSTRIKYMSVYVVRTKSLIKFVSNFQKYFKGSLVLRWHISF